MTDRRRDGGERRQNYQEPRSDRQSRPSGRSGTRENYYGAQNGYRGGPEYRNGQDGSQGQPGYGNAQGGYYGTQGYYQEPQNGKRKKKKKKHSKLLLALEIIVLLFLALGIFTFAQLGRVDRVKLSDILVNSGIVKSGYRNIALFGVDSRTGQLEGGTNSDTIMVASINQRTGETLSLCLYTAIRTLIIRTENTGKQLSVFRRRSERSVNMLNKNLDLDIKDFVTVDFNAIIKAVDLLGGIELDITEEERGWLNGYLVETSEVTGVEYTTIDSPGLQTVTGIQAMAYCRIRYTEGWDYKRTGASEDRTGKDIPEGAGEGSNRSFTACQCDDGLCLYESEQYRDHFTSVRNCKVQHCRYDRLPV